MKNFEKKLNSINLHQESRNRVEGRTGENLFLPIRPSILDFLALDHILTIFQK